MILKVLTSVVDVVKKIIPDKDLQVKVENALNEKILTEVMPVITKELEAKKEIIVAESKGESWLQRNWRPMLMALFMAILFNNYLLAPYMSAFFGKAVIVEVPADLWDLLKLGVGGYIVSRGGEKIVKNFKEK